MMEQEIEALSLKRGVVTHQPLNAARLAELRREYDLRIPPTHEEVVVASNGLEVYWGYFRLFGLGTSDSVDAIKWNRPDYWKFAWNDRCADYWCFAETVWGDQYAYSYKDLKRGGFHVHFLDALSMSAEVIAASFEEFFENEFSRCADSPYDVMIVRAREEYGPMETTSHLVHTLSPLLGGVESIDNAQKMDARSAMICNGDMAVQLDEAPDQSKLERLETYEDNAGRMRFRLIWS